MSVEFHGDTPYPVEYKHGPRRPRENEDLQLCAQALCLEEMTGQAVPKGAIFHYSSRRRREVEFTPALHTKVEQTANQIRLMLANRTYYRQSMMPDVSTVRCRIRVFLRLSARKIDSSVLPVTLFTVPESSVVKQKSTLCSLFRNATTGLIFRFRRE